LSPLAEVLGPTVKVSPADGTPVMVVPFDDREASVPLRGIQKEFEIPDDSPDGEMLATRTRSSGPIYLSKTPDRSSPKLMQAALEGKNVGTLEITFTTPGKNGSPQTPQYRWVLEGVRFNSYSVSPGGTAVDASNEVIEVSYESMRYQYFTIDPKTGRPASTEEVSFTSPVDHPFGLHDADCG